MAGKWLVANLCLLAVCPLAVHGQEGSYWQQQCDGSTCIASQINVNADGDAVMRTDIAAGPDKSLILSVRVPDKILLSEGPWLTVSGVYIAEMEYVHCANGCIATVILPESTSSGLLTATEAMVTVVNLDGSRRGIPVSLTGLSASLTPIDRTTSNQ